MELPKEGIFCVAKACSQDIVSATAHFPFPINLSKQRAEIAVKYIAITPTWNGRKNLSLTLHDMQKDEYLTETFQPLTDLHKAHAIQQIRQQMEAKFGTTKALIRLVNATGNKSQLLKLYDDASIKVSPDLAALFGIKEVYKNETGHPMSIAILYKETAQTTTTDIYYLKSEEIASNFFLDSKQDRIIELLHISGFETADFYPQLTYSRVEASLLEKITFTLYKENNTPVTSLHTDLYIVCHIRPQYAD